MVARTTYFSCSRVTFAQSLQAGACTCRWAWQHFQNTQVDVICIIVQCIHCSWHCHDFDGRHSSSQKRAAIKSTAAMLACSMPGALKHFPCWKLCSIIHMSLVQTKSCNLLQPPPGGIHFAPHSKAKASATGCLTASQVCCICCLHHGQDVMSPYHWQEGGSHHDQDQDMLEAGMSAIACKILLRRGQVFSISAGRILLAGSSWIARAAPDPAESHGRMAML